MARDKYFQRIFYKWRGNKQASLSGFINHGVLTRSKIIIHNDFLIKISIKQVKNVVQDANCTIE
jgi:hypothetical protein